MTPEGKVTAYFKKRLKELGIFFWKISDRYHSGRPDFLLIHKGHAIGVELKADGETPTPLQYKVGRDMEKAGATWTWFCDQEGIDDFLEGLTNE